MQLNGIHHLTAITAQPRKNLEFYTVVLGLRLVKKTVNQDDVSSYHLFYADGSGSPGTDITFFHWPTKQERRGSQSIVRTALRVGAESFDYWSDRLATYGVSHQSPQEIDGRLTLAFEDFEGQRLALIADLPGVEPRSWHRSPVPERHQLHGLGPITMSVREFAPTAAVLTNVLRMRELRSYTVEAAADTDHRIPVTVFGMGLGGPSAELHVATEPTMRSAYLGAGGVHHVAFRVSTEQEYRAWDQWLRSQHVPSSGPIDRFYFRSLYFRDASRVLFELATDGPGFAADESVDSLGESLALPPFLEHRRAEIEAGLIPLDTPAP